MEILKIENLSFTYPLCEKKAVNEMSFSVKKGDFVAVCGPTGCGKSTLLRLLKKELTPLGMTSGNVYFKSNLLNEISDNDSASLIGFVMQNPQQQIVTDKVWHELAFGLENLNVPQKEIASRVAEMAAYFGIEEWYQKNVAELSGGQKQLLNLASVMVMQPEILILDEPTAQLDPIAASEFISTLKKLNRELNLTIIIVEHRLEDIIPICDKLLVMEDGRLYDYDNPRTVMEKLPGAHHLWCAMPSASRLYKEIKIGDMCPLDIYEGRTYIERNFSNEIAEVKTQSYNVPKEVALEFKNVYFRYEKNSADVLNGLNFRVFENEIYCILGGNGAGKSTTLMAALNLIKPYSGSIRIFGKKLKEYKNQSLYKNCLSLLPQDVRTVFLKNTVREELMDVSYDGELPFDLSPLYDKHPYDLSGGQQQLVALGKVLSTKPRLLFLDEPTKGLDAFSKDKIMEVLRELKSRGMTIVTVTHDVEFAAICADRCGMFFRGNIVSESPPVEFFSGNNFYTTAACKMSRGYYNNTVTVEDLVKICTQNRRR